MLARLDAMGDAPPSPRPSRAMAGRKAGTPAVFPAPLRDYVGGDLDAVKWRPVGMGVRQAILPTGRGSTARLLFIPGGQAMPHHSHRGLELTLVLQGAFRDEADRFARGDVEIADSDMKHTPVAESGDPCVCLAATDAPLRFSGLIPRIAQPFLRI
jgi:putative transcriptional regulator